MDKIFPYPVLLEKYGYEDTDTNFLSWVEAVEEADLNELF